MAGRELVNVAEGGLRVGNVAEIEIIEDTLAIHFGQIGSCLKQRLDFGAEHELFPVESVMQWLLAQPVTRNQKRTISGIINCKCEHAAQSRDTITAEIFIKVNDSLGISIGPKDVPAGAKFIAQFQKVVDFSVKNDPDAFVL